MPYFAIYKSTDSVTFSIDSSVTSVRKYINSMRKRWNSTAIKRMRERLKPGPFFSSPSSGLGTRLLWYYSYSSLARTVPHYFPPRGVTGTSCYCFEYDLHLIKIPSHSNRESIYTVDLIYTFWECPQKY